MKRIVLFALTVMLTAASASAQVDLAGNWVSRLHEDWQERSPGPDAVDYLGLPLTPEGRARALMYSASSLSVPERQCLYYPPYYVVLGPQALKLWADTDPTNGAVLAWNVSPAVDRSPIKIWMDGRPHPSENALHTFGGFSTGVWEGNTLTARVTHFKQGYLRRNGVPTSDNATFTMHLSRHGETLTVTTVIEDPVYLSRPYILSRTWLSDPDAALSTVANPCIPESELPGLKSESVPHYGPGENPWMNEMTKYYGLPLEAVLGGAETMFPEYRKTLKAPAGPPPTCTRYCCGWNNGDQIIAPNLNCLTSGNGQLSHGR